MRDPFQPLDAMGWSARMLEEAMATARRSDPLRSISDFAKDAILGPTGGAMGTILEMTRQIHAEEETRRHLLGYGHGDLRSAIDHLRDRDLLGWHSARHSIGDGIAGRILDDLDERRFGLGQAGLRAITESEMRLQDISSRVRAFIEPETPLSTTIRQLQGMWPNDVEELFEPKSLQVTRSFLRQMEAEKSAFAHLHPGLNSPLASVDWLRMQRLLGRAEEYAEEADSDFLGDDTWETDDAVEQDAQELRQLCAQVDEAVRTPSSAERDSLILQAIQTLTDHVERVEAKVDVIEARTRRRVMLMILMFVLGRLVDLGIEWAGSHTSPQLDRWLANFSAPVSTADRPTDIQRDAAAAAATADVPVEDLRYLRVTVRSLIVFAEPAGRADEAGRLRSGQIVAIVEWHQKWRRVEWRDVDGEEVHNGWVRAKYLGHVAR